MAEPARHPAYLIVALHVKDHEDYLARYGAPVAAMLSDAGAEILVATPTVDVLEDDYAANWTVVVRFPDIETARAWYHGADYEPLKKLRREVLTGGGSVVLAEGFDPVALGLA